MQLNTLGTTDIKVSQICLGTMTWGYQNSESDAHEQLDYAIDHGVNFIDTAEMYSVPPSAQTHTLTEQYLGRWLTKQPKREQIIIATKVAGPGPEWIRNGEGLIGLDTALEGSLQRLKTDYIDLYQLHWPQRRVNCFGRRDFLDEFTQNNQEDFILSSLERLQKHVDSGKIRAIGVSNETPWGLMKYLQYHLNDANLPRLQSVQNPYSLIQREFDNHTSEVCFRENIAMLAYSPLAGGILSGKYADGSAASSARFNDWGGARQPGLAMTAKGDIIKAYSTLAQSHAITPTQMALAFVNQRFFVTSSIIGATTLTQLKENLSSSQITLSAETLQAIESLHAKDPSPALY